MTQELQAALAYTKFVDGLSLRALLATGANENELVGTLKFFLRWMELAIQRIPEELT